MKPGVEPVEKDIDQVGSRGLFFHGGSESCIQCVPPWFAIGVVALEQVIEVLDGVVAQDARGWL